MYETRSFHVRPKYPFQQSESWSRTCTEFGDFDTSRRKKFTLFAVSSIEMICGGFVLLLCVHFKLFAWFNLHVKCLLIGIHWSALILWGRERKTSTLKIVCIKRNVQWSADRRIYAEAAVFGHEKYNWLKQSYGWLHSLWMFFKTRLKNMRNKIGQCVCFLQRSRLPWLVVRY